MDDRTQASLDRIHRQEQGPGDALMVVTAIDQFDGTLSEALAEFDLSMDDFERLDMQALK